MSDTDIIRKAVDIVPGWEIVDGFVNKVEGNCLPICEPIEFVPDHVLDALAMALAREIEKRLKHEAFIPATHQMIAFVTAMRSGDSMTAIRLGVEWWEVRDE